jgi:chemotaxis protein CheX
MNVHDLLVERIRHSASDVFSTMLGVELPPGEASVESGTPAVNDGVLSLIGLAGAWVGTGCIACSPVVACRICSMMLMTEASAVDEEVLDAVAELTNMVIGSVKNDLESHLGPLGLSIPTVVFGRNFKTKSAGTSEWSVLRYDWDGEPLIIRLFLAPAENSQAHLPHATSNYSLEV